MIQARILADSQNPDGQRLTTFELQYPRFIHPEVMTHRVFSRNVASNRAIPPAKAAQNVLESPAIPVYWGANRAGMQAGEEVADRELALEWWMRGRDQALALHAEGMRLGLHKQILNRVLEPWQMTTAIVSATELDNWFWLRQSSDAQPEIDVLAQAMREALRSSTPRPMAWGDWHLPFIHSEDLDLPRETQVRLSVARCARVSYLTHQGSRSLEKDLELHDSLLAKHHMSPFEHAARAMAGSHGNFKGFRQYRQDVEVAPPPFG